MLSIDNVIAKSKLYDADSTKQAEKIKDAFNQGRPTDGNGKILSCFSTSVGVRGEYLNKNEFLLGHRNKIPELASFNKDLNTTMAVKVDATQIERIGIYKHSDLSFGAHGVYVLNVPQDKFAKAMSGNQPLLFGPGPHVIRDPNFVFEGEKNLVSQSENVIAHKNLHVIRVPKGSIAKVWIDSEPYILEYRPEPYVFNTPLFRIDKNGEDYFFNASDPVIKHGTIHILRIPAGSYVKAWDGANPVILESRNEPYIIDSAQFRLEQNGASPFFSAASLVIQHGTINIIRVPAGHIVKAWDGQQPKLLESRDEPYRFDSPIFRIVKNGDGNFFSTTEKLLEHGSIKRILPPLNHVAVVSEGGNLKIVNPSKDGSPVVLNSPTEQVEDFIDTAVQTVTFPSKETVEKRIKEKKEHCNYEVFRTKDNLEIGVTLLVGYQVVDIEKAVKTLGVNGIESHIEHVANVDMNKAISQSSQAEFLTFYQTKPHKEEVSPGGYGQQTIAPMQHYQDIVKEQLAKDLKEAGIELTRLNIESPIILDKDIAAQIQKQGVMSAEVNAKEAILSQTNNIEMAKAQREAAIKQVVQNQQNQALLSDAEAKLNAAKLQAEAKMVAARAEAEAIILRAEAEAKAFLVRAEAESKALSDPNYRQREFAKIKMDALQNIKFFPPTAGTLPPGMALNPQMLFNQYAGEVVPATPVEQQKETAGPKQ